MSATAKVILLKGNKNNPESAEHIIKFPGGSIAVCRTSADEYWAHIEVHKKETLDSVRESKNGVIVDSRVDRDCPSTDILPIGNEETINHIAVRIATI